MDPMRPHSEKVPGWMWDGFRDRFEDLSPADQHLVLASIEVAPDPERSRIITSAFSHEARGFMLELLNAETLRLNVDEIFASTPDPSE
jgi:hypothetical protein